MINLIDRENLFRKEVEQFTEYATKLRNDFYYYWTEPNKSGTKMKWELQKTWDTKRRLRTWVNNEQKWTKNASVNKGKSAGAHQLLEELRANFKPE